LTFYPHHAGGPSKLRLGGDVEEKALEFILTSFVRIEVGVKRTAVVCSLTIYREAMNRVRLASPREKWPANSFVVKTLPLTPLRSRLCREIPP
jgi:hypothetical protein